MSLTNGQKRAIHAAARQAGLNRQQYETVIWHVGAFRSAADSTASRQGFIAVMAFLEERCDGCLRGNTSDYWRDQDRQHNPRDPIIHRIRQVAASLGMDDHGLDEFMAGKHMSGGWYSSLNAAPTRWLVKLLEGLKAMERRRRYANASRHGRSTHEYA